MIRPTCLLLCATLSMAMPAHAQDIEESDAYAQFVASFTEACALDEDSSAAEYFPPESWPLEWQEDYADAPTEVTLYQFFCSSGAYNVQFIYYLDDPYYGPIPLSFAAPHFDVDYVGDDFEGAVEAITLRGFVSQQMLTNAEFDPETETISNTALWRGIGDASSSGVWAFDKGQFVLKSFEVDASYDGEINPERIVEYK
ncbi:DUF1176 domain-containing protein [Pelagibacterium luteolum]|uniref:Uncharacterized protein n=1 Tax=Pelagibacterium luteolum TaxID=440168 RepID=A0A1G7X271_9HYPH|nr:DUF1176 domain-containing protein [Pelagibacterium luteolum]SDG78251.1 Protein of unknown function [Pelagibacterium luteolum]